MILISIIILIIICWMMIGYLCFRQGNRIQGDRSKCVLVTGAASGIGLATCKRLLKEGCFVYATDVNEQALESAFPQPDTSQLCLKKLDVTSPSDIEEMASFLSENNVRLFGLINNAGIAATFNTKVESGKNHLQGIAESTPEDGKLVFDVNLFGVIRVTAGLQSFLDKGSVIVNIASVAGHYSPAWFGFYGVTKFGVVAYSDALRKECANLGIRVVVVKPGFTATPLLDVFSDITFDSAHSRFAQFARKPAEAGKGKLSSTSTILQTADDVGSVIVDRAVLRENPRPHLVVDKPIQKMLFELLPLLPSRMGDFFESLLTKFA